MSGVQGIRIASRRPEIPPLNSSNINPVPDNRCGYTWPDEFDPEEDSPEAQNSCCRNTLSDADRCAWHARDSDLKNVDALRRSRASPKTKSQFNRFVESFDGAKLIGFDLKPLDSLGGSFFRSAKLSHVDLQNSKLDTANFNNADMYNIDLSGASLKGVKFQDADLWEANLREAKLSRIMMVSENTQTYTTDLTGAKLMNADLTEARLHYAKLKNTSLITADLEKAELIDADLRNANLERANLSQADFTRANLLGSNLHGVELNSIKFSKNTVFGKHYVDSGDDIDKAIWTWAQIEQICRKNAFPQQFREALAMRKDLRRHQYWKNSAIPIWIRLYVYRAKRWTGELGSIVNYKFKKWVNSDDTFILRLIDRIQNKTDSNVEKSGQPEIGSSDSSDEDNDDDDGLDGLAHQRQLEISNTADENINNLVRTSKDSTTNQQYVNTIKWAVAAFAGGLTRYGESPLRVIGISVLTINLFGILYPFAGGIVDAETTYRITSLAELPTADGLAALTRGQYFSVITFTTIGYANVAPHGAGSRLLVGIESFLGALLMALLVFVVGRRSTF